MRAPDERDPASTTLKPRDLPRSLIGRTSCLAWLIGSWSVGLAESSWVVASSISVPTSASTVSRRCLSRPCWVCWRRNQPTALTTSADSTTVLTTTRAWIDRRQNLGARCRTVLSDWRVAIDVLDLGLRDPGLVADSTHGHHDLGVLRVVLDLGPQPCTCTLTSRVSAAWRYPQTCSSSTS